LAFLVASTNLAAETSGRSCAAVVLRQSEKIVESATTLAAISGLISFEKRNEMTFSLMLIFT
jgi:hypothetical protein